MLRGLLASLLLLPVSVAAQIRPAPDGDLFFHVIPAKTTLGADDTLLLKLEVTNVGRDPILLRSDDLCLNPDAGVSLSASDGSGKEMKVSVPLTCKFTSDDADGFVRIAPDAFYGRVVRLQVSKICPAADTCTLTFTLHGTLTREAAAKMLPPRTKAVVFTSDAAPIADKLTLKISR